MTRLPPILHAVPQTPHVHLEIAKAIQSLAASDEKQRRPIDPAASDLDPKFTKHCAEEISREILPLIRSLLGDGRIIKAAVDDPKHPGWPAHTPDSKGGEFRPKDGLADLAPPSAVEDGENSSRGHVRVAMEPKDPVTGEPFWAETPINVLGGGERGGGFAGRSTGGSSEAAAAEASAADAAAAEASAADMAASVAQDAGSPQVGSFAAPEDLTFGTTSFGNYAHEQIANLLKGLYPDVTFDFRVLPGQRGIDVTVLEDAGKVGYQYAEIKPLTPSGESSFNRQLQRWGVGPVQPITYDAAGNVYYGFR
jgi:hypothetical protein